jgi:SAM-dependent methyltransferase
LEAIILDSREVGAGANSGEFSVTDHKPQADSDSMKFDPIWEEIYRNGHQLNLYPESSVVSFVFRNYKRAVPRKETRILEIGCGAGNNLWFAAREGFSVAGIDGSESAINFARQRFAEEGLEADLRVGDFTDLPFPDGYFDMAINRAAVTQTGLKNGRRAVSEVCRTLQPGGLFYNEIYSSETDHGGMPGPDGITTDIQGRLAGVGQICFYGEAQIRDLFPDPWQITDLTHKTLSDVGDAAPMITAEWLVVAQKKPA